MAAFGTIADAEIRAYALVLDRTWVSAHAALSPSGAIIVRAKRFMLAASTPPYVDAWAELTDDAAV